MGASTTSTMSVAEFERLFESLKNWGRWGPDDEKGTLNYITPDKMRRAASRPDMPEWKRAPKVRSGR